METQEFNLEEYFYILWKRKWILILPIILALPTVYFIDKRRVPLYQARTVFEITPQQVGVNTNIREETAFTRTQNFHTLLYLLHSRNFLQKALDTYKRSIRQLSDSYRNEHELEITNIGQLSQGLTLQIVNTTNLIRLVAVDTNPVRCAERANRVTEALKEYSKEMATKNLKEVQVLLERQLTTISGELLDLENKIKSYKTDSKVISIASEQNQISANIQRLNSHLTQSELNIQELRASLSALDATPSMKDLGLDNDAAYRQSRDRLLALDTQLASLLSQYTENHPSVKQKRREINGLRSHLQQNERDAIKNYRNSDTYKSRKRSYEGRIQVIERKVEQLRKSIAQEQARMAALPAKEQHLSDLERRRSILDNLYVDTSKKFREIQIAILSRESDIKILEVAAPPSAPFSPRIKRDLVYAFWGALAVGIVLLFIVEHVHKPLNTPRQVEDLLGIKNLGNIARIDVSQYNIPERFEDLDEKLVSVHEPQSLLNDAYRKIRTNLMTLGFGEEKTTLLITSSISGEGKSLTVGNLAANFANIGKKTLIVDCDLRTPRQGSLLAQPEENGILQALRGTAPVADYITSTGVANLWLLPAGKKDKDFVEALTSPRLEQLIVQLKRTYDVVLLDTPPLELVADGLLLAPLVDGVLLVVSLGMVSSPSVVRSLNGLLNVDSRIVGAVANLHRAAGRYGYGTGYGYGYNAYSYRYKVEED